MKYRTIYADPPWNERGGGRIVRGAQRHYPLMKTREICKLIVDGQHASKLAENNAHLYLWVTNNKVPDGLQVVEAWGFEYKTIITWGKDKFGLGQYYRGQTEQVLFAVRGLLPHRTREDGKRAQGRTLIYAPSGKHSVKPEDMRKWIEEVSHGPYIDLFCSQDLPGWSVWGNEVETDFAARQSEAEVTNEDRVEIKSPPIPYGV